MIILDDYNRYNRLLVLEWYRKLFRFSPITKCTDLFFVGWIVANQRPNTTLV